jgi:hypothetical protein
LLESAPAPQVTPAPEIPPVNDELPQIEPPAEPPNE